MLHWNSLCSHVAVFCLLFLGHSRHVNSQCTPPISGSWYRPYDLTTITFTGSQLEGHETTINSASSDDYACWRSTGSKYVFRLEKEVDGPLGPTRGYFCWQLVPLTSTTALLYQLTSIQIGSYFTNQRVVHRNVPDTGPEPEPSISEVCSLDSTVEYPSILYKVSNSSASVDVTTAPLARQNCPADVVATYSYQKDSPVCSDGVSQLDFCLDRQTARVNANCSDEILFSNNGVLSCLAHFTRGDKLFMILLNEDSTLTGTTTRFACLEIEGAGSAVAYAGDCTNSTITASGTVNHALSMTKTASCSTDGESGGTDIVPIIVGVVVAVVIVIAVLVVLYVLYMKGRIGRGRKAIAPTTDVLKPKPGDFSKPPGDSPRQNGTTGATTDASQSSTKLPPIQNTTPGTNTPAKVIQVESPRKLPPIGAASSNTPAATNSCTPAETSSSTPAATSSSIPAATSTSTPAATSSSTPAETSSSTPAATSSSTPAATSTSTPAATNSNTPAATK